MAATPPASNPPPAPAPRVIPGLTAQAAAKPAPGSKRNRKKKTVTAKEGGDSPSIPDEAAPAAAKGEHVPAPRSQHARDSSTQPPPPSSTGLGLGVELPSAQPAPASGAPAAGDVPAKPITPVNQVIKRLKALKKKIQRIDAYQTSGQALNEDQKRAVASLPALHSTVKELQDLLQILEDDEKEDELRIQAIREEEEAKVQARVEVAISATKKSSESDLALLLQFLHLYSLIAGPAGGAGFAPPILPAVIESATAQEVAAIQSLFHELANGPISGGGGDAMQRISSLRDGHDDEVASGVSYGQIKNMILGLTAPPTISEANIAPPVTQSDGLSASVSENGSAAFDVPSDVAAASSVPLAPQFMQPSEVLDTSANEDVRPTQPAEAPAVNQTESSPPPVAPDGWDPVPHEPTDAEKLQATTEARTLDWAHDVETASNLPPLEGLVETSGDAPTAEPIAPAVPEQDGFQEAARGRGAHPGRGRGERGRGRGSFRGGDRGSRGGPRGRGGPPSGVSAISDNWRTPREGLPPSRDGSFRGAPRARGEGRGGPRGRGDLRGGPRGGMPVVPNPSTA